MATATTGLTDRLARTTQPGEGLSLVLERALSASGLRRGLAVYADGGAYRVLAIGLSDRFARAVREHANDEDTPLGDAIRGTARRTIPSLTAELESLRVLPLACDDRSWGGVLLDAASDPESVEVVAETFQRYVPLLDRIRTVRELQTRADRLTGQRDLLTTIVNSLPDPVVLTDPNNSIILANDRADLLFSATPDDSEGRRRAVQMNNLLFTSFLTQSVISTRQDNPRELTLVDPTDGSDLLFEVLPVPVPQAAPEGGSLSILRNITDLKRALSELEAQFQRSRIAEERVREEWERLNATLENVGDPILVTDERSNIILMNREGERLFDAPPDAPPDSRQRRAVRANDTKFTSVMSDLLLRPEQRRVEKVELHDPHTDTEFPAEVVSSKILNSRGEPSAIVSVIHDLTQVVENERLARELRELNDQLEDRIQLATLELEERNRRLEWQSRELEKASRLKSEFLASMSHELRTPINAVLGYASLMREEIYGELTDKQRTALGKINIASQHLLDLINDILDLSKIEAGKMPVHVEEAPLRHVLAELAESVEPLVREKSLELRLEVDQAVPSLHTDRTKLKQILLNLLSNAVKFTAHGSVTLTGECVGADRVRITVADTGIGIKEEDLEQIFEDFRQVDQSPTREYGGTGLGLSITRKLVQLLDGSIHVESQYGQGSRFVVELPLRLGPDGAAKGASRARSGGGGIQRDEAGGPTAATG